MLIVKVTPTPCDADVEAKTTLFHFFYGTKGFTFLKVNEETPIIERDADDFSFGIF